VLSMTMNFWVIPGQHKVLYVVPCDLTLSSFVSQLQLTSADFRDVVRRQ